jgi:hypothetical protein
MDVRGARRTPGASPSPVKPTSPASHGRPSPEPESGIRCWPCCYCLLHLNFAVHFTHACCMLHRPIAPMLKPAPWRPQSLLLLLHFYSNSQSTGTMHNSPPVYRTHLQNLYGAVVDTPEKAASSTCMSSFGRRGRLSVEQHGGIG